MNMQLRPHQFQSDAASPTHSMNERVAKEKEGFAKAFYGLESEVIDLTRMARLAQLQLHEAVGDLRFENGKYVEAPETEATELAIFTVDLLADKVKELEQRWYRLFNEAVTAASGTN